MPALIAGRVLQGLGGGGLDVLSEIILADITSLKERPLYLGLYALPMAGGGVCGPLIGAALSEYVSWRWIGWINLPIIAVGICLAFFCLKLRAIDTSFRSKLKALDWTGMLLFTIGSTLFALPVSWAGVQYPWATWQTLLLLFIGVVVLVVFAFYEARPSQPVMPHRLFSNITASMTLVASAAHGAVLYPVLLYLPIFFQAVFFETPFRSAVSVLPTSVLVVAFSIFGVLAVETFRRYRLGVIANFLLMSVGVGLWALWKRSSSRAMLYGFQVIGAIGVGSLFTMLTIPMTPSVVNVDDMGIAAGILVSFRLFGALIGLAICSAVFDSRFASAIAKIPLLPHRLQPLRDVKNAMGFIPELRLLDLPPELSDQVVDCYRDSIMAVFLALAGMAVVGWVASLFIKELSIEREEMGKQQLEMVQQREDAGP